MPATLRTAALTTLAMIAFATNSILCRLALANPTIDPASFTSLRLGAGALALALVVGWSRGRVHGGGDWTSAAMLFLYAVFFSFAYLHLGAGTGALILFGAVQLTMFVVGLRAGEHFRPLSWLGLAVAIAGLVYLVSPGLTAPSPFGAGLMAVAGVAWGVYSLRGRRVADPLGATAGNFARAVPLAVIVSLVFVSDFRLTGTGVLLAIASGRLLPAWAT